jgi:hypothetical protein
MGGIQGICPARAKLPTTTSPLASRSSCGGGGGPPAPPPTSLASRACAGLLEIARAANKSITQMDSARTLWSPANRIGGGGVPLEFRSFIVATCDLQQSPGRAQRTATAAAGNLRSGSAAAARFRLSSTRRVPLFAREFADECGSAPPIHTSRACERRQQNGLKNRLVTVYILIVGFKIQKIQRRLSSAVFARHLWGGAGLLQPRPPTCSGWPPL